MKNKPAINFIFIIISFIISGCDKNIISVEKNGVLELLEPHSNTIWYAGENNVSVSWYTEIEGNNVKLELFKGNELFYVMQSTTNDDGSLDYWDVPDDIISGTNYRVKITRGDIEDFGDFFTIEPGLNINEPNEDDYFVLGQENLIINWDSYHWSGLFTINLRNNDLSTNVIEQIADSIGNAGIIQWNIPETLTPDNAYYIEFIHYSTGISLNSRQFNIMRESKIISPNESSIYVSNKSYDITWITSGISYDDVSIELYKDSQLILLVDDITDDDGESYFWTPTLLAPDTGYQIKITHLQSGSFNFSDEFMIDNENISIIYPNSSTFLIIGVDNINIQWETRDWQGDVKIELWRNNNSYYSDDYIIIKDSTINDGQYSDWVVPSYLQKDSDYKIKITHLQSEENYTYSNTFGIFEIGDTISVSSPDSYTQWFLGTYNVSIYWDDGSLGGSVKIELYKSMEFVEEMVITYNDGNDNSWDVPSDLIPGNDYQIKITHLTYDLNDFSDNFIIAE